MSEACQSWFTADGLKRAVEEAKKAGAAAWTFHTGASHYLNQQDYLDLLDPGVEVGFLSTFRAFIDAVTWGS